jgi:Flp pilus assembly protein TadG
MKKNSVSYVLRVLNDQRGQVIPWVTLGMVTMLGMAGLTIDVGHAYVVRSQLQGGTNAAALAAAQIVYSSSSALTAEAKLYASNSGEANTNPYATGTPTVEPICVQAIETNGATCSATGTPNAVLVTETANVPTTFMNVLGIHSMSISTTALASMASPKPYNVAIIEDATGSMATADSLCGGASQYQCALSGIQQFLETIKSPCSGPGPDCTPANSKLRVALFMFPNMITTALGSANACNGTTYTSPYPYTVYTLPKPGATSYAPMTYTQGGTTWSASYEVTYGANHADTNGFVSDYYDANGTSTYNLNPNSAIVQAVGYGGTASGSKTGCMAISPGGIDLNGAVGTPGPTVTVNHANVGEGITYYASVIYAAQAALTAEKVLYPTSQNAIILLSDGQANLQWIYFPQGTLTQTPSADTAQPSTISSTLGFSTLSTTPNTSAKGAAYLSSPNAEATALNANTGTYPDFLDECQQAIAAGQFANDAGTQVYTIAYGSENTGCGSGSTDAHNDVTLVPGLTGRNVAFTIATLNPCVTMENIASSPMSNYFFGVQQSGSGVDPNCTSSSSSKNIYSTMTSAWGALAGNFLNAKLLPSNIGYIVVT